MWRVAIKAFGKACVLFCVGIQMLYGTAWNAAAQEPSDLASRTVEWADADYTSFAGFVKALEGQRYVALIFKRVSADLKRGQSAAIKPLMERYLKGRHAAIAGTRLSGDTRVALLKTVNDDIRAGLAALAKSSALLVPENLRQETVAIARRITDRILDPSAPEVGETALHDSDNDDDQETEATKKKTRAENTGLFRDIVDMVSQPHLQFLVGGDPLTAKARVAAEILKIAMADHLLVDAATAEAFADKLIEADVLHPDERHYFLNELEVAAGLKAKEPAESEPAPPAASEDRAGETEHDDAVTLPKDDAEEVRDGADHSQEPVPDEPVEAPVDLDDSARRDRSKETPPPARAVVSRPRTLPPGPRIAQQPTRPTISAKGDFLITAELGGGLGVPLHKGDLSPVGQKVDIDPGLSTRLALGAAWINAVGAAHVSLSLVGIVADARTDRLLGVAGPGTLDTTGSRSYFGLLPFLAFELPVARGVNLRLGAGVGIAHQRLKVVNAGARIVAAKGTSLLAQLGAGARLKMTECLDAGLDIYATYLDAVKGRGIGGGAVTMRSTWDLAAIASLRLTFGRHAERSSCGLFRP